MVIAPLVQTEATKLSVYIAGSWASFMFFITGYILESKEIKK